MVSIVLLALIQIPSVDSGPIPNMLQFTSSERTRNPALEKAFLDALEYDPGDDGRYYYNKVDLNGDGKPEILVLVVGRMLCGSCGCPLFVMTKQGNRYVVVSEIICSNTPVIVSDKRTNGWNDLILRQRSHAGIQCLVQDGQATMPSCRLMELHIRTALT
jgi:hypothetical protein